MKAEDLIVFEREIADAFNAGKIRAPVHLSGGNEAQLIEIFRFVRRGDWCFSTWRSHYHCLLKGVPPEQLRADILAGNSISLCYPEHRILSSAIVAGIAPIALGVAAGIKRRGGGERVFVFVGDMAKQTGTMAECLRFVKGHELPIQFIVENNHLSVCTNTDAVWGPPRSDSRFVGGYFYELPWPHSGAGKRVEF